MQFDIKKVMVAVTAPPENIKEIRNAMCEAGAGIMGDYTHCSINMNNVATFIPNEQANPYIGQNNKLEFVASCPLRGRRKERCRSCGRSRPATGNPCCSACCRVLLSSAPLKPLLDPIDFIERNSERFEIPRLATRQEMGGKAVIDMNRL